MVKAVASKLDRPLVVFIPDVETTLCSTFERHEGFLAAFGSLSQPGRVCWRLSQSLVAPDARSLHLAYRACCCCAESLQGADEPEKAVGAKEASTNKRLPILLLGGTSLGDTGSHLTPNRCACPLAHWVTHSWLHFVSDPCLFSPESIQRSPAKASSLKWCTFCQRGEGCRARTGARCWQQRTAWPGGQPTHDSNGCRAGAARTGGHLLSRSPLRALTADHNVACVSPRTWS